MRLPRPYIPLRVRVQVAARQLRKLDPEHCAMVDKIVTAYRSGEGKLHLYLCWLIKVWVRDGRYGVPELHHRPALCNRHTVKYDGKYGTPFKHPKLGYLVRYDPDANDPDYLIYLPADDHDIETRVRGQHGDYSDLAKARKRKRIERKAKRPKRKWPSRPFRRKP